MRPEAVRALYGRTIPLSASKIDGSRAAGTRFSCNTACAPRHGSRQNSTAPLFGSFVHDVLEHVVREAQEQGGFAAMTDGEISALTERCMDNCMKTYLPQGQAAASRESYLSARNRQEAAAVVMDVARELRLSQFAPAAEELRFAPGGPLPPDRVPRKDRLRASNRADRPRGHL